MAAATNTFSHYDRKEPSASDDSTLSTPNRRFVTVNTNSTPPRPGQHLDDADLLAWRRQFANIGLREQNVMSNSADDLSQLVDHIPYQFEHFGQDYNDMDDDELHFDNGNNYDYDTAIQERLKKANEDFKQDETPVELKHRQRVSFDAVVKAVDIVQDSQELDSSDSLSKQPVSPVAEEPSTSVTSSQTEINPHEYTVPLNDTQPKEGPSLLQQIKSMQFHGGPPIGERFSTTNPNPNATREEDSSLTKPNSNNNNNNNSDLQEVSDMTTKSSSGPQRSMVVAINGQFKLQDEDDYTAKQQTRFQNTNGHSERKTTFAPTPPTEPKQRTSQSFTRPKSSDSGRRTDNSNNSTSKSWSDNKNKSTTNNQPRAKSAGVSKSLESFKIVSSGVDFDALNRKAAREKREKEEEERRKKKEEDAKREQQLAKAKESFEKWVQDKDAERKRFSEEKRLEKEEHDVREAECEKELAELREKKYQKWIERKNREVLLANEFKKLQAEEEELASGGSSSSIHNPNRKENHRAFHRWLRRKYEQSREEQRQLRLEARRLRRRQRRSIKRFQLQQDLQLAKSFGYS